MGVIYTTLILYVSVTFCNHPLTLALCIPLSLLTLSVDSFFLPYISCFQQEFRRAFLDQLMDLIQDVYDFFQSNYKTYCSGPLFKLFRVIDLKLAVFLRTIFKSSLTSWEELVDRYTTKAKTDIMTTTGGSVSVSRRTSADKASNFKRLSVGNKFSKRVNDAATNAVDAVNNKTHPEGVPPRDDGMIPASTTQKKLFLRNSEVLFPMETRTPLFQAELIVNEGKMILEPSIDDIQGAFVQAVDKMVSPCSCPSSVSLVTLSHALLCIYPSLVSTHSL